jgi:hypothetical protein
MCALRSFLWQWLLVICLCLAAVQAAQAQGAKQAFPETPIRDTDADHVKERSEWFARGRLIRGRSSAELRRRAYEAKMQLRSQRAAAQALGLSLSTSLPWSPLGPMPLASDATGNGTQDYHQVSGRATAVVIDPADPSGNTVYIAGAQGGIRQSGHALHRSPRHPAGQFESREYGDSCRDRRGRQFRRFVFWTWNHAIDQCRQLVDPRLNRE